MKTQNKLCRTGEQSKQLKVPANHQQEEKMRNICQLKINQQPLANQGDITTMENMPIDNIYSLSYSLIIKGYKVNIGNEIVSQLQKQK